MTEIITRGGGLTAFRILGATPDYQDEPFSEKLREQRFRTIENAASEEVSIGWVTPGDPSGESFDLEDMDAGIGGAWLRFRVDKKSLPTKKVQLHIRAAERAKGSRLSAKERRELKDDLAEQLLPRVIPTIRLVDALVTPSRVLLFSSAKAACESFASLWWHTFGSNLAPLCSRGLADLAITDAGRIENLDPIRWPVCGGDL